MKRRIAPFLAGVLSTLMVLGLGITALAASGTVEFNTVGILFNGVPIARAGDSYPLSNGAQAPASSAIPTKRAAAPPISPPGCWPS